jgi:DNA-binding CsgD family transcriptional regulator
LFGAVELRASVGKYWMLQNELRELAEKSAKPPLTRAGDIAAMLRVMRPLNLQLPDPTVGHRRLLADLCRFIGVKVGTVSPESLGLPPDGSVRSDPATPQSPVPNSELSARQQQTLRHLLDGDSEKQVAKKLDLSQHTVHGYVKALYRRYGVSSRAELLAKHLKK